MKQLPSQRIGFYFSELAITMAAYLLVLWYFIARGFIFTAYNWEICGLIVLLFFTGIALTFTHLRRLYREETQIDLFEEKLPPFQAAMTRLHQQRLMLSPEQREQTFRKAVDEHFAMLDASFIKTRLYRISNMVLFGALPDQETLSHLLSQQEDVKGSRVRYIAGILVMVGLLGTFLGLVQAVQYLQHFFVQKQTVDFNAMFSDMEQTLGGLDKAFGTSIAGITAYLVLGYMNIVLGAKQAYILNRIEHLTSESVLPIFWRFREKTNQDAPSQAIEILQTIPSILTQEISAVLEQVMLRTIGGSSENLKNTGEYLKQASEGLCLGQQNFTETVQSFGGFLSSFQSGGEQLASSQEAILSGVRQFSLALTRFEGQQQSLTASLELTQRYIENSEKRLNHVEQMVEQMSGVWEHHRTAFDNLAQTVQQEHVMLVQATSQLQDFSSSLSSNLQEFLRVAQDRLQVPIEKDIEVHQQLIESFTLLTSLVHEMKRFIFDEQNGLRLLSTSLNETFGETKFQFHQFTEHLDALQKRLLEHQAQLAQSQETVAAFERHFASS